MSTYKLELDIPHPTLSEPGYCDTRLIRDVDISTGMASGSNCIIEPQTGTLMLKPVQFDPDEWYKADYDSLRTNLSDYDSIGQYWQSNIVLAPATGAINRLRTGGFTLIQLLALAASTGIKTAQLYDGRNLIPILASKAEYPSNQAFHVELELHGQVNGFAKDVVCIRFGDFRINFHLDGTADLYWNSDGNGDDGDWLWKCRFGVEKGNNDERGNIMGVPVNPIGLPSITIIPFGRGNIWVRVRNAGNGYDGVYTHSEAAFDAENNRYEITKAGKIVIYVPESYQQNIGISISRVGYKTSGTFSETGMLPYAPTNNPILTPYWVTTMGSPSLTAGISDDDGNAWSGDGIKQKYSADFTLTGDGTCTPFLDSFLIEWPAIASTQSPALITIDESSILSLAVGDGDDWEDQKCSVSIRDDGSDTDISALSRRSRIVGRLMIDDEPYGIYEFRRPKTIYGHRKNTINLQGWNYGISVISRRKWWTTRPFEGWSHPGAIRKILQMCGWQDDDIITDTESVDLPESTLQGSGTDKGQSELKSQPQVNTPIRQFIEWIIDNISNWPLRFAADGKWYYQKPASAPLTPEFTIKRNKPMAGQTWEPWYEDGYSTELEPPESNWMVMIGQADDNSLIGNIGIDKGSIASTAESKPINYLGEVESAIIIDKSLNTQAVLDRALGHVFDVARQAVMTISWKGPFDSRMTIGKCYTLEGIGDVKLTGFDGSATSKAKLTRSACMTYEGELQQ